MASGSFPSLASQKPLPPCKLTCTESVPSMWWLCGSENVKVRERLAKLSFQASSTESKLEGEREREPHTIRPLGVRQMKTRGERRAQCE
jgi:hypothetical protein